MLFTKQSLWNFDFCFFSSSLLMCLSFKKWKEWNQNHTPIETIYSCALPFSTFQVSTQWIWWWRKKKYHFCECQTMGRWRKENKKNVEELLKYTVEKNIIFSSFLKVKTHFLLVFFWHLARVQNHFYVVIRLRSNFFKCFRHTFHTTLIVAKQLKSIYTCSEIIESLIKKKS